MVEPRSGRRPDPDLERALAEVGQRVAFPPTPDLAGAVHARLALAPATPRDRWRLPSIVRPRRLALACLVLLLLAGSLLALSPQVRTAIAKRFGVHGVEIVFIREWPTPRAVPVASPVGDTLLLGERVTLAGAQSRVPYPIRVPRQLGAPDEVYLRTLPTGLMVSLLYRPRSGLPAAAETGVGALLMQFPAATESASLAKRVSMGVGFLTEVSVNAGDGYWITGASELVIAPNPAADPEQLPGRPSANVLLWEEDGLTFRLESALSLAEAVQIAESLSSRAPRSDGNRSRRIVV